MLWLLLSVESNTTLIAHIFVLLKRASALARPWSPAGHLHFIVMAFRRERVDERLRPLRVKPDACAINPPEDEVPDPQLRVF